MRRESPSQKRISGEPDGKRRLLCLRETQDRLLKELEDSFDMIFMDAAKGQYINWLPDVMRLMKNGGVLISDNVLQEGDIIESHYLGRAQKQNHI